MYVHIKVWSEHFTFVINNSKNEKHLGFHRSSLSLAGGNLTRERGSILVNTVPIIYIY